MIDNIKEKIRPYAPPFYVGAALFACGFFESLQQKKESLSAVSQFIDTQLPASVGDIIYNQAEDFLSAPGCVYAAAAFTMPLMSCINPKVKEFVDNNFEMVRSAVGFSSLIGYELYETYYEKMPFSPADIVAYAAGITLLMHKKDIVEGFKLAKESLFGVSDSDDSLKNNGLHV